MSELAKTLRLLSPSTGAQLHLALPFAATTARWRQRHDSILLVDPGELRLVSRLLKNKPRSRVAPP